MSIVRRLGSNAAGSLRGGSHVNAVGERCHDVCDAQLRRSMWIGAGSDAERQRK
jgi:hypothetical protein